MLHLLPLPINCPNKYSTIKELLRGWMSAATQCINIQQPFTITMVNRTLLLLRLSKTRKREGIQFRILPATLSPLHHHCHRHRILRRLQQ